MLNPRGLSVDCLLNRGFHKNTKFAMLALLPTLHSHLIARADVFVKVNVNVKLNKKLHYRPRTKYDGR